MTDHHTSRLARAKNKDRARAQSLRDRKKQAGAPGTHTLNRAVVHAFMIELQKQRKAGRKVAEINVSAEAIIGGAMAYLTEGTHGGNSYSRDEVRKAIVARVRR